MDNKRLPQNTYLIVAKNITLGLLQTFSPQDYVEVFSFNSSNVASLGGAAQIGASYNYLDPAGRPELSALEASVNNLAASPSAAPSDLTKVIVQALNSLNTANKLKVAFRTCIGVFVRSISHFITLIREWCTDGIFCLQNYRLLWCCQTDCLSV